MKKSFWIRSFTVLTLVGALALSMAGCKKEETKKDLLTAVREAGKLKIAMEGAWAPWTYHNEADELVGYDVEVGKEIAKKLGVEADFYEGDWDGLFAGLETGRYDVIINGVEWTEERAQKYDFSDPYLYIRTVVITKSDNDTIHSFEDLSGKKTANSINSTYMMIAEEKGATVMGVDSLEETINMVLAGRVDATLNAEVSFTDYMAVHPEAPLKVVATSEDASNVVIPLRKGEETKALREAISKAVQELHADGTLSSLSIKYFGRDLTK